MPEIPDAPVEAIRQKGEAQVSDYVRRERLTLIGPDGMRLPAMLHMPAALREKGRAPAILIYAGHGTIRQTAGLANSYHNSNAAALAKAGFVTLTIEGRGFGELHHTDHLILDASARLVGGTWMGLVIGDGLRGLDYLQTLPFVDPQRLGVAGMSVGGALALYTAALDERICATVVCDYMVRFDSSLASGRKHTCQHIPHLRRYAELSDIASLVAPRPALYVRTAMGIAQDPEEFFNAVCPVYEMLEVPDRLRYEESRVRGFDNDAAARWFKRWLVEEEDMDVLRRPYRPD